MLLEIAIGSPDEINVFGFFCRAPSVTGELTRVFDIACSKWGEDDPNHVRLKLLAE